MENMLDNCKYNKVKLLHELSCALWFIKKHAKGDAQKANDTDCMPFLDLLEKDLESYVSKLQGLCCK